MSLGRGWTGEGSGGAYNHVNDGVDGIFHIKLPGWLQAGGGEVAAVGMVCGNDVEPLVLWLGDKEGRVRPAGSCAEPVPRGHTGDPQPPSGQGL